MLTISTDLPDIIKKRRGVHGLKATMLSDRDLAVIDAFGFRNQLMHSGPSGEGAAEALPVPTTMLVDASGKVLWIEHSNSYQWRSGPEVVLAAIQSHLDAI